MSKHAVVAVLKGPWHQQWLLQSARIPSSPVLGNPRTGHRSRENYSA